MGTKSQQFPEASHSIEHSRTSLPAPGEGWRGFAGLGQNRESVVAVMVFCEGLGDNMRPPTFLGLGDTSKGLPSHFSGINTFPIRPSQGMTVYNSCVGLFSGWNRPHLISFMSQVNEHVPLLGTGEIERTK